MSKITTDELKKDLINLIRLVRDEDGQSHGQWQDFMIIMSANRYIRYTTTQEGDKQCPFVRCMIKIFHLFGTTTPRKNLLYTQSQLVGDESLITRHGWALGLLGLCFCATVRRFIDSIRGVCYPSD